MEEGSMGEPPVAAVMSSGQFLFFVVPRQFGWRQDNGNRSNQESKFDFLATRQRLLKIYEGQQKIKIVRTNQQSNLGASCQSIFSLCRHHPTRQWPENQIWLKEISFFAPQFSTVRLGCQEVAQLVKQTTRN